MSDVKHKRNPASGFTLIELLVVIAVIAVLASVVLASLGVSRRKARDAQRMFDMTQLQLAIELYYDDVGSYPTCTGGNPSTNNPICAVPYPSGGYGNLQTLAIVPTYMPSVPLDPLNISADYGYYYARGYRKTSAITFPSTGLPTDYVLATRLEGQQGLFSGWNVLSNKLNVLLGNE